MPPLAAEPGQSHGQTARSGAGLNDPRAVAHAKAHADVADILGIQHLGLTPDPAHQIVQSGLHDPVGLALKRLHLDAEACFRQGRGRDDAVRAVDVLTFKQTPQRAFAFGTRQNEKFAVSGHEKSLPVVIRWRKNRDAETPAGRGHAGGIQWEPWDLPITKGSARQGQEKRLFCEWVDSGGPQPEQKNRLTRPLPANTFIYGQVPIRSHNSRHRPGAPKPPDADRQHNRGRRSRKRCSGRGRQGCRALPGSPARRSGCRVG